MHPSAAKTEIEGEPPKWRQGRDAELSGAIIRASQRANGSADTPRAPLVEAGLLRNLKIADGLGLLTPENRRLLSWEDTSRHP